MITILPHLGLGDQLILNGLVRHFAEQDDVTIFVKHSHERSVAFMYRDLGTRVKIIKLEKDDGEMITYVQTHGDVCGKVLALGAHAMPGADFQRLSLSPFTTWLCVMYLQAGLNPNAMYRKFKVDRDRSREFPAPDEPYVFVHDDEQRGRVIKLDTTLKVVRPKVSKFMANGMFQDDGFNIFDYMTIIENAQERHMMNSSYSWLVELFDIGDKASNFFHMNVGAHDYWSPEQTKTFYTDDLWTFVV
jgi:hypothetical protein